MTSTATPLADADAVARWCGLERHRVVVAALVAGLGADALVRPGASHWEWAVVLALALTLPGRPGRSWGERLAVELRFALRRHLTRVELRRDADSLTLDLRGKRRLWCYEFTHRGRLDLSGADAVVARRLAGMAESLALSGTAAHLALHVDVGASGTRTTLSTTSPAAPPEEWRPAPTWFGGGLAVGRTALLERRHYLRSARGVVRTLRVDGFAPGRESSALEVLADAGPWLSLSLHAEVLAAAQARRRTSRAVHRVGADAGLARAAGFRWTASREFELDTLRRREQAVASGVALCRWALYLVVSAPSIATLRERVEQLDALARTAGVHLERGTARQRDWFAHQLPGGVGW